MKLQKKIILEDADIEKILEMYAKKKFTAHGNVIGIEKDEYGNFVVAFEDSNMDGEASSE